MVRMGDAVSVLEALREVPVHFGCSRTRRPATPGPTRIATAAWARSHGVMWREWPQFDTARSLRQDGWARRWDRIWPAD